MFTKSLRRLQANRFVLVVAVSTVVALALLLVTTVQGPRVRNVQFDVAAAVRLPQQRMIIRYNQPLRGVASKQVHIYPAAKTDIVVQGNVVGIQFAQPLIDDTTYSVRVAIPGHQSEYRFHTPVAQAFYKVIGNTGESIFKTTPTVTTEAQKDTQLFTAKDISEYTVAGNDLYVNTLNDDYTSNLTRVNTGTRKQAAVQLPFAGTVSMLQASPDGRVLGFVLLPKDKKKYQEGLYVYDIVTKQFTAMIGIGKKRFEPLNWKFANDSRTLVVKDADASMYIVDRLGKRAPTPFGQFGPLNGFTADRSAVITSDIAQATQFYAIDVRSLKRNAYPAKPMAADQILTSVYPLTAHTASLLYVQQLKGSASEDQLFYDDGSTRKLLYQADETSIISGVTIAPNDQYTAIEVTDLSDNDKTTNIQTIIIKTTTGERLGVIQGLQVLW